MSFFLFNSNEAGGRNAAVYLKFLFNLHKMQISVHRKGYYLRFGHKELFLWSIIVHLCNMKMYMLLKRTRYHQLFIFMDKNIRTSSLTVLQKQYF